MDVTEKYRLAVKLGSLIQAWNPSERDINDIVNVSRVIRGRADIETEDPTMKSQAVADMADLEMAMVFLRAKGVKI